MISKIIKIILTLNIAVFFFALLMIVFPKETSAQSCTGALSALSRDVFCDWDFDKCSTIQEYWINKSCTTLKEFKGDCSNSSFSEARCGACVNERIVKEKCINMKWNPATGEMTDCTPVVDDDYSNRNKASGTCTQSGETFLYGYGCSCSSGGGPPPGCNCTAWDSKSCGGGSCSQNNRLQTRTCPNNCADESRCVSDDSCVPKFACDNGSCVRRDGGPYTSSTCGGNCLGPISGTVSVHRDNGDLTPLTSVVRIFRKPNSASNYNFNDDTNNNGNYAFTGLIAGSIHDIKLANTNDNTINSLSDDLKVNHCVYEPDRINSADNTPWVRENREVPNSGVDFNLHRQKYAIKGKIMWDPNGSGGGTDLVPYVAANGGKIVTVKIVNEGRKDTTIKGENTFSIDGNDTNSGGKKYTVAIVIPPPSGDDQAIKVDHQIIDSNGNPTSNKKEVTVNCADVTGVTFLVGPKNPSVSGTVWVDNPNAGTRNEIDALDTRYTASQVRINLNPSDLFGLTTSNGSGSFTGNYKITNVPPLSYTAVLFPSSLKNGYSTIKDSRDVTVGGEDIINVDFLVRRGPATTFSISGGIFIDDGDGVKENGEDYVNAAGDEITIQGYPPITDSKEVLGYSRDVSAGFHTVTLNKIRSGYVRTFPSTSRYSVTAGPGCTGNPAVICDADGNLSAVDFGITFNPTTASWYQGVGGYMRDDKGSSVTIPATVPKKYFSLKGSEDTPSIPSLASPGVVFNFNINGGVSTKGWYVANSTYRSGAIKTSYTYIKDALIKGTADQENLFGNGAPCGNGPNCNNFNSPGGYYYTDGNLTLKGGNTRFANNSNYVFLIDGDLNIDTDLDVPQGTTVIFAVSGNITVNKNVDRIEGIFSTDKIFTVESKSPAAETQLIIEGSIIANALRSSADTQFFVNQRDLGDLNDTTPSVKIIYRPDFVLNAPDLIRYSNYNFQEVAPQGQ